ncbi:polyketide cyclase [Streptomyces griseobrunneus]
MESWPQIFSDYDSVEVLERSSDVVRYRMTTRPEGKDGYFTWVVEQEGNRDALAARSRRVEPAHFEFFETRWEFEELPQGVNVRRIHDFAMKPTASDDDHAMTQKIDQDEKVELEELRTWAERQAASTS